MNETQLRSGNPSLDALVPRVRDFLSHDVSSYVMFGRPVRGYRSPDTPAIWIRDHSEMLRGAKYWEPDMKSAVDHFAEMQTEAGWLFDYFTMTPEKVPCEKENWAKYVRVPVEADVEYRFVKAVFLAWQATGDLRWMKGMIPRMEKALRYVMTDPWRWDVKRKLVKRAYTIDTWDFDYTAGRYPWLNFRVDEKTFWGIMHGDSSGYYEAFMNLALMHRAAGNAAASGKWRKFASGFRDRANRASFNGTFYRHRSPITPVEIPGVDSESQLTLSNPMDINRGLATHPMAVSIIDEYRRRGRENNFAADWVSVDPPFPPGVFGEPKLAPGSYVNGGLMPLVGGELARAAFDHGREAYAVEQLLRYEELTRGNETYLWYFPDGRPSSIETSTSPDASPTDGWGSTAMLYALIEGLAGVVDASSLFRDVRLSPRWAAAGCDDVSLDLAYAASGAGFEYRYTHDKTGQTVLLGLRGKANIDMHLLLPPGARGKSLRVNGRPVRHSGVRVEESSYLDARFPVRGRAEVAVHYEK
ncbi:MAG TPA: hypothetical protein VMF59_05850 [Bacteroidota bacterium]|nr:hypothetical protein [Bacteroidota bacterium]